MLEMLEQNGYLAIVLRDLPSEFAITRKHFTESGECANDRDVDLHRTLTSKHGRQHGDAVLGKRLGWVPPPAPT